MSCLTPACAGNTRTMSGAMASSRASFARPGPCRTGVRRILGPCPSAVLVAPPSTSGPSSTEVASCSGRTNGVCSTSYSSSNSSGTHFSDQAGCISNLSVPAVTSTSGQQSACRGEGSQVIGAALLGVCLAGLLWPGSALASEGTLSGGALDLFKAFLDQVETLGPLGVLLFIVTVMLAEMVPLFPTQPLSLASGLLFGGVSGSLYMLLGVTLAAINAYSISKGVGRPLAEKVISYELGSGGEHGVGKKLAEVQAKIEQGNFTQQFIAVLLLRLTPVVPFSASNYVLGLTPVQFPAFVGGTLAGMSVWSFIYASLGGASRSMLDSGKDLGTLFVELAEQSGSYTKTVATVGAVVIGLAALYAITSRDAAQPATSETEQLQELELREEVKEKLLQNK